MTIVWLAVVSIIVTVVANLLCYVANENGGLHKLLHLPHLLFLSNRSELVPAKQRPQTFWCLDLLDPRQLVSSYFVPSWVLLALRLGIIVFFAIAVTLEGAVDGFPEPGAYWLVFFTDWSFCLFGLMGILGSILSIRAMLGRGASSSSSVAPAGVGAVGPADLEAYKQQPLALQVRWDCLSTCYCLLVPTVAASELFLAAFYWIFLHKASQHIQASNLMKHGFNNLLIALELLLSRDPLVSYHFQLPLLYGSIYLVFMWVRYAIAHNWVYDTLSWAVGGHVAQYCLLPVALFIAFMIWFVIAALREFLGRRSCCTCCGAACRQHQQEVQDGNIEMERLHTPAQPLPQV